MYILLIILLTKLIIKGPLLGLKKKYPFLIKYLSIKGEKVLCEEGFENYFKTIDKQHIKWSFLEEKRCREQFHYSTMTKDTWESYEP